MNTPLTHQPCVAPALHKKAPCEADFWAVNSLLTGQSSLCLCKGLHPQRGYILQIGNNNYDNLNNFLSLLWRNTDAELVVTCLASGHLAEKAALLSALDCLQVSDLAWCLYICTENWAEVHWFSKHLLCLEAKTLCRGKIYELHWPDALMLMNCIRVYLAAKQSLKYSSQYITLLFKKCMIHKVGNAIPSFFFLSI